MKAILVHVVADPKHQRAINIFFVVGRELLRPAEPNHASALGEIHGDQCLVEIGARHHHSAVAINRHRATVEDQFVLATDGV